MRSLRAWILSLFFSLAIFAGGCASHSATTVSEDQFATLYNDDQTYNMVRYMGSDDHYDYFALAHVTVNKDGTDATIDKQVYYRAELTDQKVKNPFPLTSDENKWRLMRPKVPASTD